MGHLGQVNEIIDDCSNTCRMEWKGASQTVGRFKYRFEHIANKNNGEHLPSWELTSQTGTFESMIFLFPFGGICDRSLEGSMEGKKSDFSHLQASI